MAPLYRCVLPYRCTAGGSVSVVKDKFKDLYGQSAPKATVEDVLGGKVPVPKAFQPVREQIRGARAAELVVPALDDCSTCSTCRQLAVQPVYAHVMTDTRKHGRQPVLRC